MSKKPLISVKTDAAGLARTLRGVVHPPTAPSSLLMRAGNVTMAKPCMRTALDMLNAAGELLDVKGADATERFVVTLLFSAAENVRAALSSLDGKKKSLT